MAATRPGRDDDDALTDVEDGAAHSVAGRHRDGHRAHQGLQDRQGHQDHQGHHQAEDRQTRRDAHRHRDEGRSHQDGDLRLVGHRGQETQLGQEVVESLCPTQTPDDPEAEESGDPWATTAASASTAEPLAEPAMWTQAQPARVRQALQPPLQALVMRSHELARRQQATQPSCPASKRHPLPMPNQQIRHLHRC